MNNFVEKLNRDISELKRREETYLTDNYALKSRNRRLEEANQELKTQKYSAETAK